MCEAKSDCPRKCAKCPRPVPIDGDPMTEDCQKKTVTLVDEVLDEEGADPTRQYVDQDQ